MPKGIGDLQQRLLRHAPLGLGVLAQLIVATALLVPLSACGGSPMTVESRYVDPSDTQPTIDQQLAVERQKARRGHD
jgi:hypothetical protein